VELFNMTKGYVEASGLNEVATLKTVKELDPTNSQLADYIDGKIELIKAIAENQAKGVDQLMENMAGKLGVSVVNSKPTKLEKKAMALYPVETKLVKQNGYSEYRSALIEIPREKSTKFSRGIGSTSELQRLCTGEYNALEMKKILDTQYKRVSDLETIIEYIEYLKDSGLVSF